MSLYLGNTPIANSAVSRNVGEIVASTIPLTDAGLHLLDGALINGSGSYADFVTYIAGLVSNYPDLFTTEASWQSSVSTYGVCGKFVYDSTNRTVRLPKITGITEGTTDVTALGDLVEAGLPNITGATGLTVGYQTPRGAFYTSANDSDIATINRDGSSVYNTCFDASSSSSIYGNSSTVQPQAIKVLYYIVIATSTKTQIEVDIDEVMTDLNGKVDKADLSPVHVVVDTYSNGASWYRVYDDGWCEQGGFVDNQTAIKTITLLKPYANTSYSIQCTSYYDVSDATLYQPHTYNKSTSSFQCASYGERGGATNGSGMPVIWQTSGYII